MKVCRFSFEGRASYGIVENETVFASDGDPFKEGLSCLKKNGSKAAVSSVKLLAPCEPTKIAAIGLNYKAHAAEFNKPLPEEPMLFLKPSTAVIGPDEGIVYPSHMSHRVDYEGELAVVIGRRAKDVAPENAKDYILGYTCFNDVTARDLQGKDIQYSAKGFDTSPAWVPDRDGTRPGGPPRNEFNGEKRQDTSTTDMIFDCFISELRFSCHDAPPAIIVTAPGVER